MDAKGIEVSPEWLEANGFELKDGAPVKKAIEPEPEPEPKDERSVKVLAPGRTVKLISTPEQQAKSAANFVRSELDLLKGGV